MNQPVPEELISAYFDGEVTPEERAQVEHLLESSPELRQALDDTSKLSALLHSFPRETVPSQLSKNVQRQVESLTVAPALPMASNRRSLRREWIAFAAGIAATTLATLLVWISITPASRALNSGSKVARNDSSAAGPVPSQVSSPSEAAAGDAVANLKFHADGEELGFSGGGMGGGMGGMGRLSLQPAEEGFSDDAAPSLKLKPQTTDEFLASLKHGDVIEKQVLNPNNTVMVVELTVIDIEKGVEGIKVLFNKRNLRQASQEDLPAQASSPADRKSTGSDGLAVLYVRATGTQLAETLSELITDQADVYRALAPMLSIEYPAAQLANRDSADDEKSPSVAYVDKPDSTEQDTLASEGNVLVQSFAASNHMKVDLPLKVDNNIMRQFQAKSALYYYGPVGRIDADDSNAAKESKSASEQAEASALQDDVDKKERTSEKAARRRSEPLFEEFRVVADEHSPSSTGKPAKLKAKTSKPDLQSDSKRTESKDRASKPSSGREQLNHDLLMRMLIVLKPEQVAPSP